MWGEENRISGIEYGSSDDPGRMCELLVSVLCVCGRGGKVARELSVAGSGGGRRREADGPDLQGQTLCAAGGGDVASMSNMGERAGGGG